MKILLATDGSQHSRSAVDLLKQTPFASPGDEISVLVVVPTEEPPGQGAVRREGENLARREAQRLQDVGCTVHTVLREGDVAKCILDTAEEIGAELVVVGSRGLSTAGRFLLGSVSQKMVNYASCSVLVARPSAAPMSDQGMKESVPLRILVAFDGSEAAQAAVEDIASLPLSDDTEIRIVTVLPLISYFRQDIIQKTSPEWRRRQKVAQAALESAALVLRRATPRVTTALREGSNEAEELLEAAAGLDAGIVVLGHKGKGAVKRFLLGSVSTRVTHHAKCSVWVVRRPSHTPRQD